MAWVVLIALGTTQACAATALTLFGVEAGITGGTGVPYALDGVAYKTFTASPQRG